MRFEIKGKPAYATVRFELDNGEELKIEPGSMIAMSGDLEIEGKADGGILAGLGRKFLTGESFFTTTIKSNKDNSDLYIAPRSVGDVMKIDLNGTKNYIIQGGGYLASTIGINTKSNFQGVKGFFSGEGLFMIQASGKGSCFISSFGGIEEYNLKEEDGDFIVDNAHIVAFEDTLNYTIDKAGKGLFNMIKTGEGLITRFSGNGKLYIQTRNVSSFAEQLNPFIANGNNSKGNAGLFGNIFGD